MHRYWNNGFNGDEFDGMMNFWNHNSGWFIVYDLVRLLIIAFVVVTVVRMLLKAFSNGKHSNTDSVTRSNRAIDLLQERYASGEIDEEEYKNRLKNLKN